MAVLKTAKILQNRYFYRLILHFKFSIMTAAEEGRIFYTLKQVYFVRL